MSSTDEKAKVLKARRREEGSGGGCLGKILFVLLLLAALGAGGYYLWQSNPGTVANLTERVLSTVDSKNAKEVRLYFADPQWTRLVVQKVTVPLDPDKALRITKLVELLARGPSGDAGPVLPRSAKVRQAYLGPNGLAVLDLEPNPEELGAGGTAAELLTVFALVHTITDNVEGIRNVRLLVGGKEVETLAGQVSIIEPLGPRPDLLGRAK